MSLLGRLFRRKPVTLPRRQAEPWLAEQIRRELNSSEGYYCGDWPAVPRAFSDLTIIPDHRPQHKRGGATE